VRQACCRFFIASATSSRRCSPVLGLGSGSREFLPAGEGLERRETGVEQREPRVPMVALWFGGREGKAMAGRGGGARDLAWCMFCRTCGYRCHERDRARTSGTIHSVGPWRRDVAVFSALEFWRGVVAGVCAGKASEDERNVSRFTTGLGEGIGVCVCGGGRGGIEASVRVIGKQVMMTGNMRGLMKEQGAVTLSYSQMGPHSSLWDDTGSCTLLLRVKRAAAVHAMITFFAGTYTQTASKRDAKCYKNYVVFTRKPCSMPVTTGCPPLPCSSTGSTSCLRRDVYGNNQSIHP
jgi:hypothetical protein